MASRDKGRRRGDSAVEEEEEGETRWRIGRGAAWLSGGVAEWWGSVSGGWRRLQGRWLGEANEVAAVHT